MSNYERKQEIIIASLNAKINALISLLSKEELEEYGKLIIIEKDKFVQDFSICSLDESNCVDTFFGV